MSHLWFRYLLVGCALCGVLCLPPMPVARAQDNAASVAQPKRKRVALVIGNTNYGGASQLTNPVNDAKAMAKTLKTLGFGVMAHYDLTAPQMVAAINAFHEKLDANTVALVYFSGHGAQVNGENYLIPVGFKYQGAGAMQFDAVPAARVTAMLGDSGTPVNIVIIDACRDNPFAGKRGGGKGLSFPKAETGTLIAYATAPGSTADDNDGGTNGLYTSALLAEMVKPGVSIETVFKRVRVAVKAKSDNKQTPWESSSLSDDFYFVETNRDGGATVAVATTPDPLPAPMPESAPDPAPTFAPTSGKELHTLSGHTGALLSAAFSPDGGRVITASHDRTACIWDATTGTASPLFTLSGHGGSVLGATFSPDGSRVVTVSNDRTAKIWDTATGTEILTLSGTADASPASNGITVDGDEVAEGTDALANSGIKVGGVLGKIAGLGRGKQATLRKPSKPQSTPPSIRCAAFSPDGARIVTGSDDKTAKVWDATVGNAPPLLTLAGHTGGVHAVAFSTDGRHIVTGGSDQTVRLWDAVIGTELRVLRGHTGSIQHVVFSPDGSRVAASNGRTAKIWNTDDGKEQFTVAGKNGNITSVAFSADGQRIVTGGSSSTAILWNADSGTQLFTLAGPVGAFQSAAFSPDGTRVVTAGSGTAAKIWVLE